MMAKGQKISLLFVSEVAVLALAYLISIDSFCLLSFGILFGDEYRFKRETIFE